MYLNILKLRLNVMYQTKAFHQFIESVTSFYQDLLKTIYRKSVTLLVSLYAFGYKDRLNR